MEKNDEKNGKKIQKKKTTNNNSNTNFVFMLIMNSVYVIKLMFVVMQ